MKGNLSEKQGFLGQLEEADLSSIADILEERYGDRLDAAEEHIEKLDSLASATNDLAAANAGVLNLHEEYLANAEYKENKANKINMKSPSKEKYPSEYAVAEAINNVRPDVDLSDYATKKHVTETIQSAVLDSWSEVISP